MFPFCSLDKISPDNKKERCIWPLKFLLNTEEAKMLMVHTLWGTQLWISIQCLPLLFLHEYD